MKREIKFRSAFFNIKTDKFSHFHYWGFLNHKNEYDEKCFKAPAQNSHAYRKTDDQFTGLKDKNGKEIYGGDIIKTVTGGNMVINWDNRKASFVIDREGWAFRHFFGEALEADECEIIGNIYENPELLNT